MSTFTVTTRAFHHPLDAVILCPQCGNHMKVFDVTNKKGNHWGTAAECLNGCKGDEGELYTIFSYDLTDLQLAVKKLTIIHSK